MMEASALFQIRRQCASGSDGRVVSRSIRLGRLSGTTRSVNNIPEPIDITWRKVVSARHLKQVTWQSWSQRYSDMVGSFAVIH
jgi:hypothetical protein